ncbi:MAG: AAA family ATPase [Hyphomicrobiaceae bacterium]
MQTLSVCSTKGGAGKTTLAAALAVAAAHDHLRVALIDIDPQQTLRAWWEDRGRPENPELLTWKTKLGVRFLPTAVERAAAIGYDLLIIDTPPAIMGIIELAVGVADVVLIATQPSPADLVGNKAIIDMVRRRGTDFAFIINRAEPRGDTLVPETQTILNTIGPVIGTVVMNRLAYRASLGTGQSAAEIDPTKAGVEITNLWKGVKKELRAQARKVA